MNKSKKVSNVDFPIRIEDDETKETQHNYSREKESSPIMGKPVEEKSRIDTSSEASFWKKKYFAVLPNLQNSLIDLELGNQLLWFENKPFVEDQKTHISNLNRNKKEDSVTINSLGINIFVNSKFKNYTF